MIRKHAAVVEGEYREWAEDLGPRSARRNEVQVSAASPRVITNGLHGRSVTSPVVMISARSSVACCGLMQTPGNPCARCFQVVWYPDVKAAA